MRRFAIALLLAAALASATADSTTLAVSVRDAVSGDPIADAEVHIPALQANGPYYVEEARYLFRELPAGPYEVEVYSLAQRLPAAQDRHAARRGGRLAGV